MIHFATTLLLLLLGTLHSSVAYAHKIPSGHISTHQSELWSHWKSATPDSNKKIDHSAWQTFLDKYILVTKHGSTLVRYGAVNDADHEQLKRYIRYLSTIDPKSYNRNEILAFWINLHNALIVDTVISHYPKRSIQDINISPGFFSHGPWLAKLITIDHFKLSLHDIKHHILRPIWKDPRIHYTLTYASYDSPSLQSEAFTGDNMERLLEKGAKEFINSSRAIKCENAHLKLSMLFFWYQSDYIDAGIDILTHLEHYVNDSRKTQLKQLKNIEYFDFDWRLDRPRSRY